MTEWNVETALNHHAGCSVYDDGACTCGLRARREQIERSPLAPGEGTWSVFAQKVVAERDAAREEVERLRKDHERSIDWYRQRFNRLRRWVKEEVEPLSADVARRYFAVCANGSPSPHESADWRETMHGLSLERDSLRAENERLTRIVENYDRRLAMLAKIARGVEEKVGRYLEYHGPSCDEHENDPDEFCATCRMDTAANDAISELKFWSRT